MANLLNSTPEGTTQTEYRLTFLENVIDESIHTITPRICLATFKLIQSHTEAFQDNNWHGRFEDGRHNLIKGKISLGIFSFAKYKWPCVFFVLSVIIKVYFIFSQSFHCPVKKKLSTLIVTDLAPQYTFSKLRYKIMYRYPIVYFHLAISHYLWLVNCNNLNAITYWPK